MRPIAGSFDRASVHSIFVADLFDNELLKKLELLNISARRAFRGQMRGEKRSPRTGSSVEFADYRQYYPGDDFRRIDWNAYARFDSLLLKLFHEEEDLHLYLMIDGSASMDFGRPNKFDYARKVAAALGYIALCSGDRVSLHLLGSEDDQPPGVLDSIGPRRGKASTFELFRFLERAQPQGQAELDAAARLLLARKAKPGVLVICSDLLLHSGYAEAIKRLSYERFQVMLVHILSPQELQPELAGDLRLTDSETGEHVDVSPTTRMMKTYTEHLQRFRDTAKAFAARHSLEYVFAGTDTPFEQLVMTWMRQANMLV